MGCTSNKNVEVDESNNIKTDSKSKNNKNISKSDKMNTDKDINEEEKENEEEEIELDSNDNNENTIDKLKKKRMMHEYIFYPTKNVPKNRFPKKNIEGVLPSDFANKENSNKDKQYFYFAKNEVKKNNFIPDEESDKESEKGNLLKNDVYLFNLNRKKIKSIRPLQRDEIIKSYNYQIEVDLNENGIVEKRSNKDKDQYDYLDMFPNGEGYKFISKEEERKEEKKKIIIPKKTTDEKKIENIKKNDVNDIANIINKELKENGLAIDNTKKAVDNSNDF